MYKGSSKFFYAGLVAVTAGTGAGLVPLACYKLASLIEAPIRNPRLADILIVTGAVGSVVGSVAMLATSWKLAGNLGVRFLFRWV